MCLSRKGHIGDEEMTNKLERYLANLKEEALKQIIRTLYENNTKDGMQRARNLIESQIEEFNAMFPVGW